jgi:hypothetical protein
MMPAELKIPQGATRTARLERDWVWDRDRKDMTSGREKPDVCWADVCWAIKCNKQESQ